MQTLDRQVRDGNVLTLHRAPRPVPPLTRPTSFPRPHHPTELDVRRLARLPLGLLALVGVAGVVLVQAPPAPLGGWLLLAALYFVIESAMAGKGRPFGEAGWPALVAMVPVLAPSGVVLGATLAAVIAGIVHRVRFGEPFSVSGRFLCHVPAVTAGAAVLALAPVDIGLVAVVAGALAGVTVHLQRWALPRTTGRPEAVPARHLPPWWEPVEMAGLGATAAVVGGVLATAGWVGVPIVVGALLLAGAVDQLRRAEIGTRRAAVDSLLLALEAKDLYTRGHCERVAALSVDIGEEMGLTGISLHRLETAALLHDVGKVVVDRHLLRKRGRLSFDEYRKVQAHTTVVADLLDGIAFLAPVLPVVCEHHRHFDGTGYGVATSAAGGVEGGGPVELSLDARILAAADAYDAMTTHRPYRRALTPRYAFAELQHCSGTQFDPAVVEALIRVVPSGAALEPWDGGAWGYESDDEARRVAEAEVLHGLTCPIATWWRPGWRCGPTVTGGWRSASRRWSWRSPSCGHISAGGRRAWRWRSTAAAISPTSGTRRDGRSPHRWRRPSGASPSSAAPRSPATPTVRRRWRSPSPAGSGSMRPA